MKCQFCGTDYADNLMSCPNCGTPVNQSGLNPLSGGAYEEQASYGAGAGRTYTEKEFYKLPELELCRNNIKGSAFVLYFCCAVNLLFAFLSGYPGAILDPILLLVLGILIQVKKSRVSSIIVLVYAISNMIYYAVETGKTGGKLILIAAIWAVIYTFKYQSAWKKYKKSGILPHFEKKTNARK